MFDSFLSTDGVGELIPVVPDYGSYGIVGWSLFDEFLAKSGIEVVDTPLTDDPTANYTHHAISLRFGYSLPLQVRLVGWFADMIIHTKTLTGGYEIREDYKHKLNLRSHFNVLDEQKLSIRLPFDILENNKHTIGLKGVYTLMPEQLIQYIPTNPTLTHNNNLHKIDEISISCDEDSPFWIGNITLSSPSSFSQIQIGDTVTVVVGTDTFVFMVDGREITRESPDYTSSAITVISPLASFDSPWSGNTTLTQNTLITARELVEGQLGSVSWNLPNWIVPLEASVFTDSTPLTIAKAVVEAVGGVIESSPTGVINCRKRYPVNVPDYATALPDVSLDDSDLIQVKAAISPTRGFNSVLITNEQLSDNSDRLESDDVDDFNKKVYAWLFKNRDVTLLHTGQPATQIVVNGINLLNKREIVEFVEGRASVQYPIHSTKSLTWNDTDLGALTIEGQTLISAVKGYSLLLIDYYTECYSWDVKLEDNSEVQFVLMD